MTGAGSCLPCRMHHHNWLFRQGHNCLGGNGNMQNLHSCCLCCSHSVNRLSKTADLALLTGPSIHKALSPQINLVCRVKEQPHYVCIYLFSTLPSPHLMLLLPSHCVPCQPICVGSTLASCDRLTLPQGSCLPALLLAGLSSPLV